VSATPTSPTYDYCVPVTVNRQAPGQTASVTLYMLAYMQPSDVAAAQVVETQLTEMCQLLAPNELVDEFVVGQPMPVTVTEVKPL
jgi:hypothetical protein